MKELQNMTDDEIAAVANEFCAVYDSNDEMSDKGERANDALLRHDGLVDDVSYEVSVFTGHLFYYGLSNRSNVPKRVLFRFICFILLIILVVLSFTFDLRDPQPPESTPVSTLEMPLSPSAPTTISVHSSFFLASLFSRRPSFRPTVMLSSAPTSTSISWAQQGIDVYGLTSFEGLGSAVILSNNGDRLWSGGYGGILRLYRQEGEKWTIEADLSPDFLGEVFSISISADGRTCVAGDPLDGLTGAAVAFSQIGLNWKRKGQILRGEFYDEKLGGSVSVNGDGSVIAVSAWGGDFVNLYEISEESWLQKEKIEGERKSLFGISVALSSRAHVLIVGAYLADNNGDQSGSVFVYTLFPSSLLQRMDGEKGDRFGDSVAMSAGGNVLAAGGPGGSYAKLYLGEDTGRPYHQIGETIRENPGPGFGSRFGSSLALSADGRRLTVGARWDHQGGQYSGTVFVYAVNADIHKEIGMFVGEAADDYFGTSVSLSGDGKRVAIGAPGNDGGGANSGHVRVFAEVEN